MPPEALLYPPRETFPRGWPAAWRLSVAALALTWFALIVIARADWASMAGQWWNSSTYTHILLVPAILAWLVHIRGPQLKLLTPRAWWPGLVLLAGALLAWLLGALGGLAVLAQAGAVAMLLSAAVAMLGPKVSAGLAFPLGYMGFLVPFGDELIPVLQLITAKLTVALIHLSGMNATIDGVFIETNAGLFEVAEACSGVKFLIAMVAFGALVANVCYRSWRRRAAFMALAIVLPIVANGVRAWGTIFAAQFVGAERATGLDHLVYGWVFFALVIAASLGLGRRYFDRPADDRLIDAVRLSASPLLSRLERAGGGPKAVALVGMLLAVAVAAWSAAAMDQRARLPDHVALPDVPGWQQVPYRPDAPWRPRALGADHRLLARYRDQSGREVDVFYALYSGQREGREAGGAGEGALPLDGGWSWLSPVHGGDDARAERLLGPGRVVRLAETRYRNGNQLTGSNLRLKLATTANHLLLRPKPTAVLILSAEHMPGRDPAAALQAFRKSAGPLGPWMDRIARVS